MTNPVYVAVGTTITWTDSGGDYAMTLANLATLAGRVGARASLGGFPRQALYRWYGEFEWASAPSADQAVEVWFAGWDSASPAYPMGQVPATDTGYAAAAAGLSKRKNIIPAGQVIAETAAVGPFSGGGLIWLPYTHASPLVYNGGGQALKNTSGANFIRLTPVAPDIQ